jgi:phage N-6-adenine-methyltransferase
MQPQLMTSAKDEWQTPLWLFRALSIIFDFKLDAAASSANSLCEVYLTEEDNALHCDWKLKLTEARNNTLTVWLNPPYGTKTGKFLDKAQKESLNGLTIVCLIAARTDTKAFRIVWNHAKYVIFLYGRLKFLLDGKEVGTATFPSAIPIFTDKDWDLSFMERYGKIIKLR